MVAIARYQSRALQAVAIQKHIEFNLQDYSAQHLSSGERNFAYAPDFKLTDCQKS